MTQPNPNYPGGGIPSQQTPGSPTDPAATHIQDASTTQQVSVALTHTADNTAPPVGGSLLTVGVAQLRNVAGNFDNQRAISTDNVSGLGITTGANSFAMSIYTALNTATAIGTVAFFPVNMSGIYQGVPWTIQPGATINIDAGTTNAESIYVTSVTNTTFTAIASKTHASGAIVSGFVYNVGRDASGELDGASGAGTAVAAEYEYNGGHPNGISNFDRERNTQGKSNVNVAISSTAAGNNVITFASAPAGLFPGAAILLGGGANQEVVYVRRDYTVGNVAVPISSNVVNAGQTTAVYDVYAVLGAGATGMTAFGLGTEVASHWDPGANRYYALTGTAGVIKVASAAPAPATILVVPSGTSITSNAVFLGLSTVTVATLAFDYTISGTSGGTSANITFSVDRLGVDGKYYRVYTGTPLTAAGSGSATIGLGATTNAMLTSICAVNVIFGGTIGFTGIVYSASLVGR